MLILFYEKNKENASYILSPHGKFSWTETSEAVKQDCIKKVTKNSSERPFASMTAHLQIAGIIGLQNTVGIAQACVNGDFGCGHEALIPGRRESKKHNVEVASGKLHSLLYEFQQ